MTWKLQAAFAAVVTLSLVGCQACPKGCDVEKVEEQVVRGQGESYFTSSSGTYYQDNYRNGGSRCGDQGPNVYCGGASIVGGICKETCALFKVLTAYRWEGGYPDGPLHGWRGSWCGPFGEGSIDTTQAPCNPPGAY